jgi:hypothetical protein
MISPPRREIVVELERVQLIRRRAATVPMFCVACAAPGEFVAAAEAARLFDISVDETVNRMRASHVHFQRESNGEIYFCVTSVLKFVHCKEQQKLRISTGLIR